MSAFRSVLFEPFDMNNVRCFVNTKVIPITLQVGKSTLLSNLAGVYSEVAAYEFTTLTTVPGVIR